MLRDMMNRVISPFGMRLYRYWEYPVPQEKIKESFDEKRQFWLDHIDVDVVLDVGANIGQYAESIFNGGYKNRVISFEPLITCYRVIAEKTRTNPNWSVHNCALGSFDGPSMIHVAGNSLSSSLLPMLDAHTHACPESQILETQRIAVRSLKLIWDAIIEKDEKVWLKLDVQGYESQVLDGLGRIPENVFAIELELSLVPLYEGQVLMPGMLNRLAEEGFTLVCIEDVFEDSASRQTLQINGIFKRNNLDSSNPLASA